MPPVAKNDTASVTQPDSITINVAANDTSPGGYSLCLSSIYGSPRFSIANCDSITYHSDTTFAGMDTCWYVICDNDTPSLCDSAVFVVTVSVPCVSPTVSFYGICPYGTEHLYHFISCIDFVSLYAQYNNADSISWQINNVGNGSSALDAVFSGDDSLFINKGGCNVLGCIYVPYNYQYSVCITAYNNCSKITYCDTVSVLYFESIAEIPLLNINIYPNPASSELIIDMQKNNDEITNTYTAIEIYNALGQKVKTVPREGALKTVSITVSDFASGTYFADMVDLKRLRKMLGVFLKE